MIFVLKGVTVQWRNSDMVTHPPCAQAAGVMNDSPARYARLPGRQKLETSENDCLVVSQGRGNMARRCSQRLISSMSLGFNKI